MSSFAVNDCLNTMRYAGYQRSQDSWVISVTQSSLIACLRLSKFGGCLYATLTFILVHRFSIGLRSGLFPGPFQQSYLVFLHEVGVYLWSVTRNAILHEGRAVVDVHVQFQLLLFFYQFHVLGSIQSGVRRNEIQTSSATAPHGTPNNLAGVSLWLQHIPHGRLLCTWRGTNCCVVHSSKNNTFFHSARVQWR